MSWNDISRLRIKDALFSYRISFVVPDLRSCFCVSRWISYGCDGPQCEKFDACSLRRPKNMFSGYALRCHEDNVFWFMQIDSMNTGLCRELSLLVFV